MILSHNIILSLSRIKKSKGQELRDGKPLQTSVEEIMNNMSPGRTRGFAKEMKQLESAGTVDIRANDDWTDVIIHIN